MTVFTLLECVKELQLLKSPEERRRRIAEVPEIHADPKMNPNYDSEEDDRSVGDGKKGSSTLLGCGILLDSGYASVLIIVGFFNDGLIMQMNM